MYKNDTVFYEAHSLEVCQIYFNTCFCISTQWRYEFMFIEIILIFFLEFAMFKLCKDWLLGIFKKNFKKKTYNFKTEMSCFSFTVVYSNINSPKSTCVAHESINKYTMNVGFIW